MLNLLSKALSAVVLDGDARESLEEAGGLVSAIQGSADMRTVIQQLKTERVPQMHQIGGYTALTSPSTMLANRLQDPRVMTNSNALQAALMAEILASARATASGVDRPVAAQLSTPKPAPRAAAPTQAQRDHIMSAKVPASPLDGTARTLHTAIMAQALANARAAVSAAEDPAPRVVMQAPLHAPVPQRAPAPVPPPAPARGKKLPPAERQQLIQNALKVHSAKQAILSNLTSEQRAKLADLASKLLDPQSRSSGEA